MAKQRKLFRYKPMSKWTPALALRRMECRINDAKEALADIAGIWGDIDDFIGEQADERIADLDAWMKETREAVEERQAAGEEYSL